LTPTEGQVAGRDEEVVELLLIRADDGVDCVHVPDQRRVFLDEVIGALRIQLVQLVHQGGGSCSAAADDVYLGLDGVARELLQRALADS
jgi:hypothetical protein